MAMAERIYKIMEYLNLTPSQFADECGLITHSVNQVLSGRNNPSVEFIQKILIRFPEISAHWLLLGRETMIRKID